MSCPYFVVVKPLPVEAIRRLKGIIDALQVLTLTLTNALICLALFSTLPLPTTALVMLYVPPV